MRAARQLAHRRPRIQRVVPRIDQPIEAHGRAARGDHRHDDPEDAAQIEPSSVVPARSRSCIASSAPVSANGSAKTEWLKRTNDA